MFFVYSVFAVYCACSYNITVNLLNISIKIGYNMGCLRVKGKFLENRVQHSNGNPRYFGIESGEVKQLNPRSNGREAGHSGTW